MYNISYASAPLQKETPSWFTELMKDKETRGEGYYYIFGTGNTSPHSLGDNPLHNI